eukprot:COSAG02_NODE_10137_length_2013_cov_1.881400_3_plen_82_part_00
MTRWSDNLYCTNPGTTVEKSYYGTVVWFSQTGRERRTSKLAPEPQAGGSIPVWLSAIIYEFIYEFPSVCMGIESMNQCMHV